MDSAPRQEGGGTRLAGMRSESVKACWKKHMEPQGSSTAPQLSAPTPTQAGMTGEPTQSISQRPTVVSALPASSSGRWPAPSRKQPTRIAQAFAATEPQV